MATPNEVIDDQDGDASGDPYDSQDGGLAPLEIVNNGGSDKTISVDYTYGGSVTNQSGSAGNGTIDSGDVAELFQFSIGGSQISPDRDDPDQSGDSGTNTNQATVNAGTSEVVDFSINYTSDIQQDISDDSSGSYAFDSGGFTAVELLTQVSFGEVDGT